MSTNRHFILVEDAGRYGMTRRIFGSLIYKACKKKKKTPFMCKTRY